MEINKNINDLTYFDLSEVIDRKMLTDWKENKITHSEYLQLHRGIYSVLSCLISKENSI